MSKQLDMRLDKYLAYTAINNASMNASRSLSKVAEAVERASKAEVESRNRVDITLKEYEQMKEDIRVLNGLVRDYEEFFNKINFPFGEKVIPETIQTTYSDVYSRNPLDPGKIRVRIEFEVERGI